MDQLQLKANDPAHRSEGASLPTSPICTPWSNRRGTLRRTGATPWNDPPSTEESSRRIASATMTNRSSHRPALTLLGLFAMLAPATLALGDLGQGDVRASPIPAASPYAVIYHVAEPEQQISLLDGALLVHRRTADPFGVSIRGPFKGLPPVAEHPVATPIPPSQPKQGNQPIQPAQVPVAANEPTLEKAVQQLSIGGVNIAGREALIGSRSIYEGDLLVLQLSGRQFVVWVQSIDRRGVQFCDVNLQQHALKPFRFGPNELPGDSSERQADVHDFLKQDVH
jgi:hypothetical protein